MNMPPQDSCIELAQTGSGSGLLAVVGVLAVLAGTALLVARRRRSAHVGLGAGAGAAAIVLLSATLAFGPSTSVARAADCPPDTSSQRQSSAPAPVVPPAAPAPAPAPPAAPTPEPTPEPTVTPTPEPTPTQTPPPAPACPVGNDLGSLPAGQTIAWTPVTVPDPTASPGTEDGELALVYTNNVSGFTWHVVDPATGEESGDCAGTPVQAGACVPYPTPVSWVQWVWQASPPEWLQTGGSGGNSGCGGGGGNN